MSNRWRLIRSAADAHGVALDAVDAANRELAGDLRDRADGKEQQVIHRSHERGDSNHDRRRLS